MQLNVRWYVIMWAANMNFYYYNGWGSWKMGILVDNSAGQFILIFISRGFFSFRILRPIFVTLQCALCNGSDRGNIAKPKTYFCFSFRKFYSRQRLVTGFSWNEWIMNVSKISLIIRSFYFLLKSHSVLQTIRLAKCIRQRNEHEPRMRWLSTFT